MVEKNYDEMNYFSKWQLKITKKYLLNFNS